MVFELLAPSKCIRCAVSGGRICFGCVAELFQPREFLRSGIQRGVALATLSRAVLRVVKSMKDAGETALLARILEPHGLDALRRLGFGESAVLFVPIPSSRRSWRKRGYNLAHELARWLATNCAEPALVSRALTYVYEPQDQRGLTSGQRSRNLNDSMAIDADALSGELERLRAAAKSVAIVVCDDVVTTGATLAEANRALRAAMPTPVPVGYFALAETLLKTDTQSVRRV